MALKKVLLDSVLRVELFQENQKIITSYAIVNIFFWLNARGLSAIKEEAEPLLR